MHGFQLKSARGNWSAYTFRKGVTITMISIAGCHLVVTALRAYQPSNLIGWRTPWFLLALMLWWHQSTRALPWR